MEEKFREEVEALEVLSSYNIKIVNALNEIIPELKGEKKEDTDEYFNHILKGINWELEVINGTMHYLNQESEVINKSEANQIIVNLNEAMQKKEDTKTVDVVENQLLPFLESLNGIIKEKI